MDPYDSLIVPLYINIRYTSISVFSPRCRKLPVADLTAKLFLVWFAFTRLSQACRIGQMNAAILSVGCQYLHPNLLNPEPHRNPRAPCLLSPEPKPCTRNPRPSLQTDVQFSHLGSISSLPKLYVTFIKP